MLELSILSKIISATSENTSDIDTQFYKDPLQLFVDKIEGKITEFLNA